MKSIFIIFLVFRLLPTCAQSGEGAVDAHSDDSTKYPGQIQHNDQKDRMPRFSGCETVKGSEEEKGNCAEIKMLEFIYGELVYPKKAKRNRKEGLVVVTFIGSEKGEMKNIRLLEDIGGGCGPEALRVVKKMSESEPRWVPGIQQGKAVSVQFNLPIRFSKETIHRSR